MYVKERKLMTMKTRTLKSLVALALSLCIVLSMFVAAFAATSDDVFVQTIKVTQELKNKPARDSYTYELTPVKAENPMPEGTKDGVYSLVIKGATNDKDAPTFTIEFDASKPGDYQYRLDRVETTPEGDTVTPESHLFGYLVKEEDGKMVIIPYTCYDNKMVIWNEVDADGNPIGITLKNSLTGTPEEPSSSSTTSSTKSNKSTTSTTRSTNRTTKSTVGTTRTVTNTIRNIVNTGDPHHIAIWVALVALSAGGLIAIAALKRKKDEDEDTS